MVIYGEDLQQCDHHRRPWVLEQERVISWKMAGRICEAVFSEPAES